MDLDVKRPTWIVPSYSLTGDLLSYLRCGLQYRYQNGSALPPSRPIQLWFGEFVHGVMEAAYQLWRNARAKAPFPWPCNMVEWRDREKSTAHLVENDLGRIGLTIESVLIKQGKLARNRDVRNSAYRRIESAINFVGPHLFPLVASAEQKVIGTRDIPPLTSGLTPRAGR